MPWHEKHSFRDCPWCGLTNTKLTVSTFNTGFADKHRRMRYWATLGCPSCGGAVLIEHSDPNVSQEMALAIVPSGSDDAVTVHHLPEDVARYYSDAIRVLRVGVPDAAAVQLRRTLEAAAAHFEIRERVLMKSIEKLIKEGHVTQSFAPVLHHIRAVGNVGAHASDEHVDHDTAQRALRFTTQLLRNLFEVPGELEQLTAGVPTQVSGHDATVQARPAVAGPSLDRGRATEPGQA
ncbi:DUF4145 domain-containing protein [Streptomyces sp. NPDC093224]|uniref:DUF4145 domain-containing protein n=1 Tax=Streptomyces sp. NPDC093224 TaxID=3155198 RepID=UPI00342043D2